MKKIVMKTIGFAIKASTVENMVAQLDALIEEGTPLKKSEQGSPKDSEGHAITYKIGKQDIFFAMINSNQKVYLVRADENLFTAVV